MKLTKKQQLTLALLDPSFQVDPDLDKALAAVKKQVNAFACDAFNYGGLFFDPTVEIPRIIDAVLSERRDVCSYCGADCTDLRIGHNCHQCGGN